MPPIWSHHSREVCIQPRGLTRGSCSWPLLLVFLEVKSEFRGASQALCCHLHTAGVVTRALPAASLQKHNPAKGQVARLGLRAAPAQPQAHRAPVPIKGDGLDEHRIPSWVLALRRNSQQLLTTHIPSHVNCPSNDFAHFHWKCRSENAMIFTVSGPMVKLPGR